MNLQPYEGSCHCGALGFIYRTALPVERWSIRACQCSFCRLHDALSTSDPDGELAFSVREPEFLRRYRFGGRTADFLLCMRCGVYIGAQMTAEGRAHGIVNVHALRDPPSGMPGAIAMSYEGETAAERRRRRLQSWTPLTQAE